MRIPSILIVTTLAAAVANAQDEAALRAAFEGKLVSVKVAMPGTSRGIDVYPSREMPVDWREVAERVKDNGTALRIGDQVMITKVVVKKNSHIEFQLGGGGFGTFFDDAGTSRVSAEVESESRKEKDLKKAIKEAPGPTRRKELEKELANVRSARERENDKARSEATQANAAHEANMRLKREQGGSRFNVRYRDGIPAAALTPQGVMVALDAYLDFTASGAKAATTQAVVAPGAAPAGKATGGLSALRKGLTVQEVEALLGPAVTANEEKQGDITLLKRTYDAQGMKVTTSFVSGVLVDFAIVPK